MQFMITPDTDKFNQVIFTDDYTPEEIANNIHIENIKKDLEQLNFGYPVRIYAIVNCRPPKTYTLLSR